MISSRTKALAMAIAYVASLFVALPGTLAATDDCRVFIDGEDSEPSMDDDKLRKGQSYDFDVLVKHLLPDGVSATVEVYFPHAGGLKATREVTGTGEVNPFTVEATKRVPTDMEDDETFGVSAILDVPRDECSDVDHDDEQYDLVPEDRPPSIDGRTPSDTTPQLTQDVATSFSVSASDPDGDPLSYAWSHDYLEDRQDGGLSQFATGSSSVERTFSRIGAHLVRAQVSDGATTVKQDWTVDVQRSNEDRPPTVERVSPSSEDLDVDEGDERTFEMQVTDPDGDVTSIEWFVGGQRKSSQELHDVGAPDPFSDQFIHTFQSDAGQSVEVTATDSRGNTDTVAWGTANPDLTVTDLEWRPDPVPAGAKPEFRLAVENSGQAPADPIEVAVQRSGETIAVPPTQSADPGETDRTAWVRSSVGFAEGEARIQAVVDPVDKIAEEAESNNVLTTNLRTSSPSSEIHVNVGDGGTVAVPAVDRTIRDEGTIQIDEGTTLALEAVPGVGMGFSGWHSSEGPLSSSKRVTVDLEKRSEIVARFSEDLPSPQLKFADAQGTTGPISGDRAILGFAASSLSEVPSTPRGDATREALQESEDWPARGDGFILLAGTEAPNLLLVEATAVDERAGALSYAGEWIATSTGEKQLRIEPDFLAGAGSVQFDLMSVGSGCAASQLQARLQLKEAETGEIVASENRDIVGSKFPLSCLPQEELKEKARDVGIHTSSQLLEQALSKLGYSAGPWVGPLIELVDYAFVDHSDVEETKFDEPMSVAAEVQEGTRYRWDLVLTGSATSTVSNHIGVEIFNAVAGVKGQIEDVELTDASQAPSSPPMIQFTGKPDPSTRTRTASFTWEEVEESTGQVEHHVQLVGRRNGNTVFEDGWSSWRPDRSTTFEDLPVGTYEVQVRSRHASTPQLVSSRTYEFGVGGSLDLSVSPDSLSGTSQAREATVSISAGDRGVPGVEFDIGGPEGILDRVDLGDESGLPSLELLTPGQTRQIPLRLDPGDETGEVRISATGSQGQAASASLTVTGPPDQGGSPSATLMAPSEATTGSSFTLDASSTTDPDTPTDQLSYAWSLSHDDASAVSPLPGDTATGEITVSKPGTYTFEVEVSDGQSTDTATAEVAVDGGADGEDSGDSQPPQAQLSVAPSPVRAGQTLTLDASQTKDPDTGHGQLQFDWRLVEKPPEADLDLPNGPKGQVTPTQPGSYRVQVQASDGQTTDTAAATFEVEPVDGDRSLEIEEPSAGSPRTVSTSNHGPVGVVWALTIDGPIKEGALERSRSAILEGVLAPQVTIGGEKAPVQSTDQVEVAGSREARTIVATQTVNAPQLDEGTHDLSVQITLPTPCWPAQSGVCTLQVADLQATAEDAVLYEESAGQQDTDGDGIPDGGDECPEEAAETSDGCPTKDKLFAALEAPSEATVGESFKLDASGSDTPGEDVTYAWSIPSANAASLEGLPGDTATSQVTATEPGSYTFRIHVKTPGGVDTAEATVQVQEGPDTPPVDPPREKAPLSSVTSTPLGGAQVLVDGEPRGSTPADLRIPDGQQVSVDVRKDAREPAAREDVQAPFDLHAILCKPDDPRSSRILDASASVGETPCGAGDDADEPGPPPKVDAKLTATRAIEGPLQPGGTTNVTVDLTASQAVDAPAIDEDLPDGFDVVEQTSEAHYRASKAQWLWLSLEANQAHAVEYTVRAPSDAHLGTTHPISGEASSPDAATVELDGESTLRVGQSIPQAVAGEDRKVDLPEIQRAVNLWSEDQPVPGTGGRTLDLPQLQKLVSVWSEDGEVGG